MSKVKIINVPTKEEAQKRYDDFVAQTKSNNRRTALVLIATIILAVLMVWSVWCWLNGGIRAGVMLTVCVIAAIVVRCCVDAFEPTKIKYFWPAVYQYDQLVASHRVLKAEAKTEYVGLTKKTNVCLTLANEKNEVSKGWIYGLTSTTKTDVDCVMVDLKEEKVYFPYEERDEEIIIGESD